MERVPFARGLVSRFQRIDFRLVVVQTAGADLPLLRVPDLHLRQAAQEDAAIPLGTDLPIQVQLEVAELVARLDVAYLACAIVMDRAVAHYPVRERFFVGLELLLLSFFRRQPFEDLGHAAWVLI